MKKPSIKGMKCTEYLGRFKKDKFIQDGHNTYEDKPIYAPYIYSKGKDRLSKELKRQKMYEEFNEEVKMNYEDLMKKVKKQNKGTSFIDEEEEL